MSDYDWIRCFMLRGPFGLTAGAISPATVSFSPPSSAKDRAPSLPYCPDGGDEERGGRPSDRKFERLRRWRIFEFARKNWMAYTRDAADIEMGDLQGSDESANESPEHVMANNGPVSPSHLVHSVDDPNSSATVPSQQDNAPSVPLQDGRATKTFFLGVGNVAALLGISDYTIGGDGTARPKYLFRQHPGSFNCFLVANMAACVLVIIATAFQRRFPPLAKAIHGLAWTSVMLSYTVLLWELLPGYLSWFPWSGFVLTLFIVFGRLAYEFIVVNPSSTSCVTTGATPSGVPEESTRAQICTPHDLLLISSPSVDWVSSGEVSFPRITPDRLKPSLVANALSIAIPRPHRTLRWKRAGK